MHYYNIATHRWVTQEGSPAQPPVFVYGLTTDLAVTLGVMSAGGFAGADLSAIAAWRAAIDVDLLDNTGVMARTNNDGIDSENAENGKLVVAIDTVTNRWHDVTDGTPPRPAIMELRGFSQDGSCTYVAQMPVIVAPGIDPDGRTPIPVRDNAPEYQYSEDGEEWHAQLLDSDTYQRVRIGSAGEWSAAQTIPRGPQGPQGEPGASTWGGITGSLSNQTDLAEKFAGIENKIPEQATSDNQLVDKDFVNSSINALAAFPITRNAAKDPFRTRGELLNANTYYSGGVVRVPTTNDYAFVQSDEYYGTAVEGYTDFALTEEYVGFYVLDGYDKTMVTAENKDSLGIVPGTTVPYVELPSTRYIFNGTGFEFQFIVNSSGLTSSQLAAINSGITAEKVATYDGYATGKADLVGGTVPEAQLPEMTSSKKGIARINSAYGITIGTNSLLITSKASDNDVDAHSDNYKPIVPNNLLRAVRSVLPNITTIPSDAATPYALTDASATTNNHCHTYTHAPDSAPVYTLPDVTSTTVQHEIVLTVSFSATALSVAFQTTGGVTISLDKTITPAASDVWTFLCRYVSGSWRIYPIKEVTA